MKFTSPLVTSGLLLERNPFHAAEVNFSMVRADVRYYSARSKFRGTYDAAVFDAPWYLDEFFRWADLALAHVRKGGRVFFVLWPEDTRPSGSQEHELIFSALQSFGSLDRVAVVDYDTPPFEAASLSSSGRHRSFKREGVLYSLVKKNEGMLPKVDFFKSGSIWRRYLISSHQFAIKISPKVSSKLSTSNFEIEPRILSDTSRRNTEISRVNAWASNNVVGRLEDPQFIDAEIRKLRSGHNSEMALDFLSRIGLSSKIDQLNWGATWTHRA